MSKLNTNAIRHLGSSVDNMTFDAGGRVLMPNQPAFKATMPNSSSNLGNNVWTKIAITNAVFNRGLNFNTSLNRFTAPVSGVYLFVGHINFNQDANNCSFSGCFGYNGAIDTATASQFYSPGVADSRAIYQMVTSQIWQMTAGDYVDLYANVNGTSTASLNGGCSMSGYLIG